MSQSGRLRTTAGILPPVVPIQFTTNSGIAVPAGGNLNVLGAVVAAGTTPFRTTGLADTLTINVQTSQAIAATDATRIGLAAFNSTEFTVDANGFVSLIGGSLAIDSVAVQSGTSPVVPTGAGLITFNGAVVAAGTNPVRTDGTGANTYALEVQISQALAATDATKIGLCNFNSAQFSVDANGFVSASATGIATTITGDSGGALSPASNNWNILGRSGSKTSGSGSTLTISSPPFSQVSSTSTSVLNSGEIVTAAVTRTLPATAGLIDGDTVIFTATTAGNLVVTANTGQTITIGNAVSSSGGTATSSVAGSALTLRFDATAVTWRSIATQGNWITA